MGLKTRHKTDDDDDGGDVSGNGNRAGDSEGKDADWRGGKRHKG